MIEWVTIWTVKKVKYVLQNDKTRQVLSTPGGLLATNRKNLKMDEPILTATQQTDRYYEREAQHIAGLCPTGGRLPSPTASQSLTDTDRLDFVLTQDAFVMKATLDHPGVRWQLWTQDGDENYIVLSGEHKSFATTREAIDAAMAKEAAL